MNTSDYQKTIEYQFNSFCKTVLRNQARNMYAETKRRNTRFISLESLTSSQINELSIVDDYDSNYTCFVTHNYNIRVEDILVAQALKALSKKKKDIILLSFFLNMTNADIATLMNLAESTVHYHRVNALKELRIYMEEYQDEN